MRVTLDTVIAVLEVAVTLSAGAAVALSYRSAAHQAHVSRLESENRALKVENIRLQLRIFGRRCPIDESLLRTLPE